MRREGKRIVSRARLRESLAHMTGREGEAVRGGWERDRGERVLFIRLIFKYTGTFQEMYEYSRSGNPTRDVFEKCVAALEGAKYGVFTCCIT